MQSFITALRGLVQTVSSRALALWQRFRALPKRTQWIAWGVLALLILVVIFIPKGSTPEAPENLRSVSLRSVGELSLGTGSGSIFGTVRSVSEASILAKTSGTVEAVHTQVGSSVPAGFIIAELENASERASVLQAQGVYEAAVAARNGQDVRDDERSAESTARSAFTSVDTALELYIDTFFSGIASDPHIIIDGGGWESSLESTRATLNTEMIEWRRQVEDPQAQPIQLLNDAGRITEDVSQFLDELARVATRPSSRATAAQLEALQAARSSIAATSASVSAAQSSYRSGSVSATAGSDAAVKQALGTLRLAEATLERTRVRAPIAGTVNFLPIRVGDYVTPNMHTATVARNEALEIVAFVSEETSEALTAGAKVIVEDDTEGVITSISPALDPITKQIEVHISVDASSELVNGASVRVEIPSLVTEETTAAPTGPITLPLSAVKLRADDRVVFGIDEEGRLVAFLVETGTVRGERIEILNSLPLGLTIVTDARGLSEGQKVNVAP